jgi:hypothetical protein
MVLSDSRILSLFAIGSRSVCLTKVILSAVEGHIRFGTGSIIYVRPRQPIIIFRWLAVAKGVCGCGLSGGFNLRLIVGFFGYAFRYIWAQRITNGYFVSVGTGNVNIRIISADWCIGVRRNE